MRKMICSVSCRRMGTSFELSIWMSTSAANSIPDSRDTPETVTAAAPELPACLYRDNHLRKEQDMSAHATDMTVEESDNRWKRGFWSIWATQFQESFSDLAYRWLVFSFITHMAFNADTTEDYLKALAGILFAAPFVLF